MYTVTCLNVNFYRFTVHFDIYEVHIPTNSLFIKADKVLIYIKNHFDLLLHVSVFTHDHQQGAYIERGFSQALCSLLDDGRV